MGEEVQGSAGEMHKRRTTLEDGRYLIYYTFGDEPRASEGGPQSEGRESESEPAAPRPAAEEERSV